MDLPLSSLDTGGAFSNGEGGIVGGELDGLRPFDPGQRSGLGPIRCVPHCHGGGTEIGSGQQASIRREVEQIGCEVRRPSGQIRNHLTVCRIPDMHPALPRECVQPAAVGAEGHGTDPAVALEGALHLKRLCVRDHDAAILICGRHHRTIG